MNNRNIALRAELTRLNDLYYNQGESDASDDVYDSLKRQLKELEGESDDPLSPLNMVGAPSDGGFAKVRHLSPMLSLMNVYNEAEMIDWITGLGMTPHASLEYKLDGSSLDLLFDKGKLSVAITRGDGEVGDDITDNAMYFEGVPTEINYKGKVEIRGECIVPHHFFKKACERRLADGKKVYANPRNMVAGLMRRKEGESLQGMGIRFIAYDVIVHRNGKTESMPLEYLGEGILDQVYTVESLWKGLVGSIDSIMDTIADIESRRNDLDYDIDGMVLKITDPKAREKLGNRSTSPRWAVAYKFEALTTTSILESIEVQVGRTGVLTPVAKIRPVKLCGVTISSVTLHNFEEIARLDLRLLDTVVVSRRGDVIPKIESVVMSLRMDDHGLIPVPTECPCCGSPLIKRDEKGIELYCSNTVSCPAQVSNRMAFFVSRDGLDVKNLGPASVDALINGGSLGSFSSLFHLSEEDFMRTGFSEVMTDKIQASILRSRTQPFFKVLRAVGIPEVGDSTARALAIKYHSFGELMGATDDELRLIPDVGPTVAANLNGVNRLLVHDLEALDKIMTYTVPVTPKAEVQDLIGKTVVVTGSDFDGKNRKEMEHDVIARGGKLTKSISKKTDIVYVGSGAGPDKVKAARALGFFEDGIKLVNPNSLPAGVSIYTF
jgi:DNA ligase (NAD+)